MSVPSPHVRVNLAVAAFTESYKVAQLVSATSAQRNNMVAMGGLSYCATVFTLVAIPVVDLSP